MDKERSNLRYPGSMLRGSTWATTRSEAQFSEEKENSMERDILGVLVLHYEVILRAEPQPFFDRGEPEGAVG